MGNSFLSILNSVSIAALFFLSCGMDTNAPKKAPTTGKTSLTSTDTTAPTAQLVTGPLPAHRDSNDTIARVYLTFDDGPYTTTPALMKLLVDKGVRASFFIIGSQIDKSSWHDSVYQAVQSQASFKVYNHTYSHAITNGRIQGYYGHPESVWQDIQKNRSYLPAGVGITRLPGKNTWRTPSRRTRSDVQSGPVLEILDSTGQPEFIVGWDIEWMASTGKSREQMQKLIEAIDKKLAKAPINHRDVVILSHDYHYRQATSLDLLGELIDSFKQKGTVQFDWVENLPGLSSGAAQGMR